MEALTDTVRLIEAEAAARTDAGHRRIEGMWSIDCLYNPVGNGRIFNYKILLAQTAALGCAYSTVTDYPVAELEQLIGKDFLDLDKDKLDMAQWVAFLDSVYPACEQVKPAFSEAMEGPSVKKMRWRSEIILREAERLLGGSVKGKRIINAGVVGDILTTFSQAGADIVGTDFDPGIVGRKLFDRVDIHHGNQSIEMIAESDLCVVTGMTITTGTIDNIIECCKANNVKMIVFAETGGNLGGFYVRHGVDAYIGEVFPFYIFSGMSKINVHRA